MQLLLRGRKQSGILEGTALQALNISLSRTHAAALEGQETERYS